MQETLTAKNSIPHETGHHPAGASGAHQGQQYTLLLVDDEQGVLRALKRLFSDEEYRIITCEEPAKALAIMEKEEVQLVISDQKMPRMTGIELLARIKKKWPATVRIMLTGFTDVDTIMAAVNEGSVYKFITKPWNDEDLKLTVRLALEQYALKKENSELKVLTRQQQEKIQKYANVLGEDQSIVGNYLLRAKKISREDLDYARKQRKKDELLVETVVRLGYVTEADIVEILKKNLKLEYVDLEALAPSKSVIKYLPRDLCERNRLIPIRLNERQLTVAMADPSDMFKCDNIAMMTGLKVAPVIASASDIFALLARTYEDPVLTEPRGALSTLADAEPEEDIDIILDEEEKNVNVQQLISSAQVPPVIRIVNAILTEAIHNKASDVHLEPKTNSTLVRYRVDGMLHSRVKIPIDLHPAIVSRVKILAKLDISERRIPQDGRITLKVAGKMIDIRVSTMPTINGEKIVLRVLDKSASIKSLAELGIMKEDREKIEFLLKKPQGMIISTGPTGSGKTTLLYSLLHKMLDSSKNYQTIEDPVEYFLEDASQIFVKDKVGLSFPSVLRATMRQDPDVILVGEIRDYETADIAFKAALTGHMVLSSLHTNSAVASITRLMDMQVKPYLISSSLEGIIAQRLVRKLCPSCRKPVTPDPALLELLKVPAEDQPGPFFVGEGCEECKETGYVGRTGIFEIFSMNDEFRHVISSSYREAELVKMARAGGMATLLENGLTKANRGETALDEILRVLGSQSRYEKQCENCGKLIDVNFLYCPFCAAMKQDYCLSCRVPLEKEWDSCPFCGHKKRQAMAAAVRRGEGDLHV
ncbi:MAG: Flp pilus assembly complex ATPase component TadA [Deltaproteobacteria bacterium]|nr:Flp pilus assembly complex ATPase component TadA [Deltaproteobacteria bacterium]